MEAVLIAKYMQYPRCGVLNNYQYGRLCVATTEFAFHKTGKQFISSRSLFQLSEDNIGLKIKRVEIRDIYIKQIREDKKFIYNLGLNYVEQR